MKRRVEVHFDWTLVSSLLKSCQLLSTCHYIDFLNKCPSKVAENSSKLISSGCPDAEVTKATRKFA